MAIKQYQKSARIKLSNNFTSNEFSCHGNGCCTTVLIDEKLVEYVQQIRDHFKKPVNISSGYRCAIHNRNVGGATNSYHSRGQAADIYINGVSPAEIAKYAESIGILGIGLYETAKDGYFVHIDTRTTKSFWYGQGQAARTTFGGTPIKVDPPQSTVNNEAKIWNYLYSRIGNAYGVAGVMGNMYAESALKPNNLQNTYETKLGYTDSSYTSAVDKNVYTNFVKDGAGYGLVQWTYWTLKRDLLAYAKAKGTSIGDLDMQLEFLCKQLSEQYTNSVWNVLRSATSVLEASNAMLLKFERPADQSVTVQQRRASYGQDYYNKYASSSASKPVDTTISVGVVIGHASLDENGRTTGGTAGDQTGTEICRRSWYNKPWTKVFRPIDSVAANKIAVAMEQACDNSAIGYNQAQRTTLYTLAKAAKWDLSAVTTPCDVDCSSLVAVCVNAAGIPVSKDMYTGNEENLLNRTGKFVTLTDKIFLTGSDYLKRGDILFTNGHTAIVLTNGGKVENTSSNTNSSYVGKGIGTATALTVMNVRTGASTNYKVIAMIKAGTKVEVLGITSDGWYKIAWPSADCGYAYVSNTTGNYFSYIPSATNSQSSNSISSTVNYMVRVTADVLNIRQGPGTTYKICGCIKDRGLYTIIKENGNWGYLKSGLGWICLDYTKKE